MSQFSPKWPKSRTRARVQVRCNSRLLQRFKAAANDACHELSAFMEKPFVRPFAPTLRQGMEFMHHTPLACREALANLRHILRRRGVADIDVVRPFQQC